METTKLPAPPSPKRRAAHLPHDDYETVPVPVLPLDADGHGNGHEPDPADLQVTPPRPVWSILMAVVGVVALLGLLLAGLLPREQANKELTADAEAALNAPVPVNVIKATPAAASVELPLPGNLRPWQETSIYARTTGYLKVFYADISNQMQPGQLMAVIESPEVDQQLQQAKATLLQARAALEKSITDKELSKVTYQRYETLRGTSSVTQQDLDTKKAAYDADVANVAAAQATVSQDEANVQRLTELQNFEKVVAPFAGVVTSRPYDVGSLILADPTDVNVKPMYKIAENDVLRVFVNVPQSAALSVRKGMEVKVSVRELPGKTFTGTVMGTTNYLDQTNRTLLTEVKVPNSKNPDGTFMLLPGMYCQVSFVIQREHPPLMIPSPALIPGPQGNQVAIVQDGKAHFINVELGNDFGNDIEVVHGLTGEEQIIGNPGERIVEGAEVKPMTGPDKQ